MSVRTVEMPVSRRQAANDLAWPPKASRDVLPYELDCTRWVADAGLSLVSVDVEATPGLAVSGLMLTGPLIGLTIGGGSPSGVELVRLTLNLSAGNRETVPVLLPIRPDGPVLVKMGGGDLSIGGNGILIAGALVIVP